MEISPIFNSRVYAHDHLHALVSLEKTNLHLAQNPLLRHLAFVWVE